LKTPNLNRRKVLKVLSLVSTSALTPVFLLRFDAAAGTPVSIAQSLAGSSYLTETERRFIDAAIARLIPADDLGPGAKEAGVADFIDGQLAGSYGRAERWYMQPPFKEGTEQQGFQSKLGPAGIYRAAIAAIDEHCRKSLDDRRFAELEQAEQDELLAGLEAGKVDLGEVDGEAFFKMLRDNTVEGFFSDPMYGGNQDFAGWRLIGFPGPRYDYTDFIERFGEPYPLPPVGILGRNGRPGRGG
jgi:gluconate 2-dehydrogenase gamma chain